MLLFFNLLQMALGNSDNLYRQPSALEWQELFKEAKRQSILGVLLNGINNLPECQRPNDVTYLRWVGLSLVSEHKNLEHRKHAKELTDKFWQGGYQSVILKGLSSAARYPNPLCRQCGDIDIWIFPQDLNKLTLDNNQLRNKCIGWLRSKYEIGHIQWHHVDIKFFDDVNVEVHFWPSWLYNPFHRKKLINWFEEYRLIFHKKQLSKYGYWTTTAEFDIIFQLTHMFHHLVEEGFGLRHVVDYYYVVYQFNTENKNSIDKTLLLIKSIGMLKFLEAMMYVLCQTCGMPKEMVLYEPDDDAGKFLLSEIMGSGNFGNKRKNQNRLFHYLKLVKHFPSEAIWVIPWKLEYWVWRRFNY